MSSFNWNMINFWSLLIFFMLMVYFVSYTYFYSISFNSLKSIYFFDLFNS